MSPPAGFDGSGVPSLRARAALIEDLGRFVGEWRQALERGLVPSATRLAELVQKSGERQAQARAAQFGGIAHHLGRLDAEARTAPTQGISGLRQVLQDVSDMISHARTEIAAARAASPSSRPPPPPPPAAPVASPFVGSAPDAAARALAAGSNLLEPPRMITHFPDGSRRPSAPPPAISEPSRPPLAVTGPPPELTAMSAARRGDASFKRAPEPISAAAFAPVQPPVLSAAAAAGPSSIPPPVPAAEPNEAPNLNVRTMFGLRAFGRSKDKRSAPPEREPEPPAGSLLGLKRPGGGDASSRSHAPPPLLSSSLPSLGAPGGDFDHGALPRPDFFDDVRRQRDASRRETPARGRAVRRATPLRGRRPESGGLGWLYAALGGFGLLVVGVVAFIVARHSRATDPKSNAAPANPAGSTATPAAADHAAPSTETTKAGMPRERLLNDDERFKAMLGQLHGHGGKESPELRALVDEQAALQANMLSQKCETQDPTCVAWKEAQAMLAAPAGPPIKKRERTQTGMRSKWLAGLKLPEGLPIEDDPAVEKIFTYYSDNQVGREKFQGYLFKCGAYRDLIESTLIRYDLPQALLAVVFTESGCEPLAKSPVGAQGLWQMMPETGRGYHLRIVESSLDERQSPLKSTEAAVHFLSDLHGKLGAWDLVFAAYNLGPYALLARIHRAGDNVGFWDLVDADMLPDETANYTPTIEAFALILANLKRLRFAGTQMRPPEVTADLEVPPNTRIGLVARAAATSIREIQRMNLDVLGERAPNIPGVPFAFQVPKTVVWQARETLQALLAHDDETDVCVPITFDWGRQRFTPEMQADCSKRKGASMPAEPVTP